MEISSDQLPTFITNTVPTQLHFLFRRERDVLEGQTISNLEAVWKYVSFGRGLQCIFFPQSAKKERELMLRHPDFWYPAFILIAYGIMVGTVVWPCIVWLLGGSVVFFLQRVLNGDNSFGGTLSITGYCTLPLVIMSIMLNMIKGGFFDWFLVRFILKASCLAWASYGGSTVLVSCNELKQRKLLVLYPLVLFNLYVISLCRVRVE